MCSAQVLPAKVSKRLTGPLAAKGSSVERKKGHFPSRKPGGRIKKAHLGYLEQRFNRNAEKQLTSTRAAYSDSSAKQNKGPPYSRSVDHFGQKIDIAAESLYTGQRRTSTSTSVRWSWYKGGRSTESAMGIVEPQPAPRIPKQRSVIRIALIQYRSTAFAEPT